LSTISDKEFSSLLDATLFSSILDSINEAIWVIDFNKSHPYWFASVANKLKYAVPQDPISPNFWRDNLHPQDADRAVKGFEQALQDPTVTNFVHDYRFCGANNIYYVIHDTMRFLRNERGMAQRVIGSWRDVTEERMREQKLEQALNTLEDERNRFKLIAELSSAAMWEYDIPQNQLSWMSGSSTLEEFGFNKPHYRLQDWVEGIHEEDRERVEQNFERAMATEESFFDTYRFKKADGKIAYVIDQGTFLRDADGKAYKAVGSWVDITRERLRELLLEDTLQHQRSLNYSLQVREEELASTEEELRQINDQLYINIRQLSEREFILNQSQKLAKIGSWEYDAEHKTMFWSAEMYNIYGVDPSFNSSDFEEVNRLYEDGSEAVVNQSFTTLLKDHRPSDITVQLKTPLGYRKWVRITAHPLLEDYGVRRVLGLTYDITYFKEAEERLRSSEEKFSKAFRFSPDLMSIHRERDGVIVDVNDNAYTVLGFRKDEIAGKPVQDLALFIQPADREKFYDTYFKHGHAQIETQWRRKDGGMIDVLITSNRIEIEGEAHLLSVVKDISESKAAEERFRKAFDLSPDLMMIFREHDLVLIDVNSKLEMISGYSREEVIGQSSADFEIWVDKDMKNKYFESYFQEGSVTLETQFYGKDSIQFFGSVTTKRIQLSGENHMLVVVRDMTERKKAEEKIIENEAKLDAIINNTDMSIWSLDLQYKITALNRSFHDMVLYNTDDVTFGVGQNVLDVSRQILPEEYVQYWKVLYNRAFAGESVLEESELNGRAILASLHPIIENNRIIGASIYAQDITERKQKEEELNRKNLELAEANKKIGGLKLMALRSVMNPHFIFNALNSIQFFIAKNDRQNAINYLSTFSKLIRGVLNHSVNDKISIADELDLLKHYINLEMVRFENKFEFVLEVDPELDIENIEIPSLLIQPYVENAILHGLYNKQEKGLLKICVRYDGDRVLFIVEDDGIGREAARKLREKNFPKHTSMGTVLTEERLRLINELNNVSLGIDDRVHPDGSAAGTRISIWARF
jgi:PAS domain S-box-containing protein